MNNLEQSRLILAMIRALRKHESWCGETHLQKAIYFLQNLFNIDTGFNYILYIYGPFSFDLKEKLANMIIEGEISVEKVAEPYYGPTLSVGTKADKYANIFEISDNNLIKRIKYIANKLGKSDVHELENLSTALYFRKKNPTYNKKQIAELINEVKPHIDLPDAEKAAEKVLEIEQGASKL